MNFKNKQTIKQNFNANKGNIVIYQAKNDKIKIEVKLNKETVWLTQKQISDLFLTERSVITKHLKNIFSSKELNEHSVCAKIAHTAGDGKTYKVNFYNLDAA